MEPNECFLPSCQQWGDGVKPSRRIGNTHAEAYLHALVTKTQTHAESLLHDLLQEQRFLQTVSPAAPLLLRVFVSQPTCTSQSAGYFGGKWLISLLFIALCTFSLLAWRVWSVCVPQLAVSCYTRTLSFVPSPRTSLALAYLSFSLQPVWGSRDSKMAADSFQ